MPFFSYIILIVTYSTLYHRVCTVSLKNGYVQLRFLCSFFVSLAFEAREKALKYFEEYKFKPFMFLQICVINFQTNVFFIIFSCMINPFSTISKETSLSFSDDKKVASIAKHLCFLVTNILFFSV